MYQAHHQGYYLGTAGHRVPSTHHHHHQYLAAEGAAATSSSSYHAQYAGTIHNAVPVVVPVVAAAPAIVAPAPTGAAVVEETNGGISPVLEYNIGEMSSFLSWCTFGILKQSFASTKEFERLVSSVLFATRLPKSTIIIALEYINQRYATKQALVLSEAQIFTILTVSLVLANKFNDDNTFTNRSWCGAAGLAIDVLNYEEREWLNEVKWQLNVVKFEDNIRTLEECWSTWLQKQLAVGASGLLAPPGAASACPSAPTTPIRRTFSIPSSPVSYDSYTSYNSSPLMSSPIKHESMWATTALQTPSIWSYHQQPAYNANPAFVLTYSLPYAQPYGAPTVASNYQYMNQQPESCYYPPPNNGFVGYTNPYYGYNMASC